MRILSVHEREPNFPASDTLPGAVRYPVGAWWVDALDGEPTEQDVSDFFAPPKTQDEIRASLEAVLDAHVDATARSMGYRSSESCAGYAASTDPVFQAEALAFIAWRDDLWRSAIAVMQAVMAGQREIPTAAELVAEMPVFVRPGA